MIPLNITREHVLQAIAEQGEKPIPKQRKSRKFYLVYEGKQYAPKYLISIANLFANGKELEHSKFGKGRESNDFLKALGFAIKPLNLKFEEDSTIKSSSLTQEEIESPAPSLSSERTKLSGRGLTTNSERTSRVIEILMDWYKGKDGKREGLMSGVNDLGAAPPAGMQRGSYEHIVWLTLTVSINYRRDADSLWDSAKKTWRDESTQWVFLPEKLKNKTYPNLVIALAKHRLSQKPNKDAGIWQKVSNSFLNLFQGDPRKLVELYNYDAVEIYDQMRSKYKKDFPFLSGNKILPLWIILLNNEANIALLNLEKVRIPIDIHTARATLTTGCLVGNFDGNFGELVAAAQLAWDDACRKTDLKYYPIQLDAPLWNLSKNGCSTRRDGEVCPFRDECKLSSFCTANNPEAIISLSNRGKIHVSTVYPN